MRILDRYITKSFVFSFFVCFLILLALFIVIETFSNIGNVIKEGETVGEVLWLLVQYHLLKVPLTFAFLAPMVTLLAGMFTITMLNRNNELTPMKACGISVYRISWPVFALAFVITLVLIANQELLLPTIGDKVNEIEMKVERSPEKANRIDNPFARDGNIIFTGKLYRINEDEVVEPIVQYRRSDTTIIITADAARWKQDEYSHTKRWHLYNAEETRQGIEVTSNEPILHSLYIIGSPDNPVDGDDPFHIQTVIEPKNFTIVKELKKLPSTLALWKLTQQYPDVTAFRVELQHRYVAPINNIILLILGLPFVLQYRSRSFFTGLGVCMLILALFFFSDQICSQLAINRVLSPVASAWLPPLIFGSLGIVLFDSVRS